MNRKLFIYVWVFLIIPSLVSETYACDEDPNAVLNILANAYLASENMYFVPVDVNITFNGSNFYQGYSGSYDPDGGSGPTWAAGIKIFYWNYGDGYACTETWEAASDGLPDGKTIHKYTTPGCYQLTFTVTDNDAAEGDPPNKTDTYTCWITAVALDLDIDGVSDDDEQNPGGYVSVNDDDDNNNSTPDNDPSETPVTGENNLKKINLSVSPTDQPGQVHLEVIGSYKSCVKIWKEQSKTNLVIPDGSDYYKRWNPDDMPTTLWVEGITSSPSRYPSIGLHYLVPEEQDVIADVVSFTVVKVNIDAGLSEKDELSPGKYINVNWDDDDEDGWQPNNTPPYGDYTGDKSDSDIDGGDNDFRSFTVSISPQTKIVEDFPNSKVRITFPSNVKVWQTNTKKTVLDESSELMSGDEFKVENLPKQLYLEGVSGSSAFKDVELKATWLPKSFNDFVKVTVFEVDLTGKFGFGSQQEDNDKKHSESIPKNSSDKNGKISWDDANADGTKGDMDTNCEYFHNCMECQGTIKPSGVTNEVQFDIKRDKWRKTWIKFEEGEWQLSGDATPWENDDLWDTDEDLTPSPSNHIYSVDGPGYPGKSRIYDYRAYIGDFREWVKVKIDGTWYQCSDYYKWHSQMYLEWKNDTEITRDSLGLQKLSAGWITVPDSP